ncbi:CDP-glycerol:poly(glycerophosphate) glycerophosphotransferase [Liquorilactobacillus sucicola DSM 21376 = JCM 15457]|uniref:CDP-glycerol poly(Glycerophosphate) glycerophosphotransferase n=1 Tax=Liquorilactobacillus sucicola DSM 21376 = JCM 15457 TaxID=1423806 RepID=A0A023CWR8_9LACO|nr:CDP-glycerol--glycerophosphate glycerophosphotransferase [Liquorilactobacillus sucicola]KRN06308.1 hypothetical protein FD15_GL001510 [Liquorilactobacillus sucicola DSM 21376 = JCM 15457]GAJ26249.1 CDP-glycerol:poly(glycerophosphate) glycerophosphotransferase [Liquorilactobacillus sucicola DSM 21376 = JCM 15457]
MQKKRIEYFIKHNSLLKKMYIFVGSLLLRLLGIFVSTDKNLVLIVSNLGKNFKGNSPYEIYKHTKENSNLQHLNFVWAFDSKQIEKNPEIKSVRIDSIKYFLTSLKAKYWITDVNIERSLNYKKKATIYLNTWHGVALKKIGNDDKNSGRYDYSGINYLCVSGRHDEKVYTSALNASSRSFLEVGMPRNDRIYHATKEEKDALKRKFKIDSNKKIILYAPTWRDSRDSGKDYDFEVPINFEKWQKLLGEDFVVFMRAHDRTSKLLNVKFNNFVRDFSEYEDLNDLLIVADLLITDYSSILFDYSILLKPFICYCYDYEEYSKKRGFYFDPKAVYPDGVMESEEEVLSEVGKINYETKSESANYVRDKFMEFTKGNATEQCTKVLFGGESD